MAEEFVSIAQKTEYASVPRLDRPSFEWRAKDDL